MIDILIDYKETVVGLCVFMKRNAGILLIMFLHILTELFRYLTIIYINCHTRLSLGKLNKYRIINIIVNHHNPRLCLMDKIGYKHIRIEYLTIEKYTLLWLQR